jgi:hypothetical protein
MRYLKILSARILTKKLHIEIPEILGATFQNLVIQAILHTQFVQHEFITFFLSFFLSLTSSS